MSCASGGSATVNVGCVLCSQMLLSEEEVKIKTRLWFAENADYLKELEGQRLYLVFSIGRREGG